MRLWWRVAEKLFQYEYPQKTAQFCLPYNTFDLLLMSLATLIFQRCVKPFTLVNKLGNWIFWWHFSPLKKQYNTVSIFLLFIFFAKKKKKVCKSWCQPFDLGAHHYFDFKGVWEFGRVFGGDFFFSTPKVGDYFVSQVSEVFLLFFFFFFRFFFFLFFVFCFVFPSKCSHSPPYI